MRPRALAAPRGAAMPACGTPVRLPCGSASGNLFVLGLPSSMAAAATAACSDMAACSVDSATGASERWACRTPSYRARRLVLDPDWGILWSSVRYCGACIRADTRAVRAWHRLKMAPSMGWQEEASSGCALGRAHKSSLRREVARSWMEAPYAPRGSPKHDHSC